MSNPKTLIAYYSRAGENYVAGNIVDLAVGNTEVAAAIVHSATGGDLLQLETVVPYPSDYTQTTDIARAELRERARPELKALPESIEDYDVVFLGFPNWWGTAPMAVFTFLDAYDFVGKTILPFCTHEGSGLSRSERDIAKACPGAEVAAGIAIRGSAVHHASSDIRQWIESAGLAR